MKLALATALIIQLFAASSAAAEKFAGVVDDPSSLVVGDTRGSGDIADKGGAKIKTAVQPRSAHRDLQQPDFTVNTDPGICGARVEFPSEVGSTAVPSSGSLFPVGTTTIDVTRFNGSTYSFSVTVVDRQRPVVVVQDTTYTLRADGTAPFDVFSSGAVVDLIDNCGVASEITHTGPSNLSCLQLRSNPVFSVTVSIEDFYGNKANKPFTATVTDPLGACDTQPPSQSATLAPSLTPSTQPSRIPSSAPSSGPLTSSPSSKPSSSPSSSPSSGPSTLPSPTPSYAPSSIPSSTPSSGPSLSPSLNPSFSPSFYPSSEPSANPSWIPSSSPSSSPSWSPSSTPTSTPSSSPSSSPSSFPSSKPTSTPSSAAPTVVPSSIPSTSPSATPSLLSPSSLPSSAPSPCLPLYAFQCGNEVHICSNDFFSASPLSLLTPLLDIFGLNNANSTNSRKKSNKKKKSRKDDKTEYHYLDGMSSTCQDLMEGQCTVRCTSPGNKKMKRVGVFQCDGGSALVTECQRSRKLRGGGRNDLSEE